MSNFFESILDSSIGRNLMKSILPKSVPLERYNPSLSSFFGGRILLGAGANAALIEQVLKNLKDSDANVFFPAAASYAATIIEAAKKARSEERRVGKEW